MRTAAACRRTLEQRGRGTPQGSAVSPVLANLFMHYAFDLWLAREFPTVRFERYCDDAVVHCGSERQALAVKAALADRLAQVGLTLHPDKTKIVYCRDGKRRGAYPQTSFTFLGYTFRARTATDRWGRRFTSFLPAVSPLALKAMGWRSVGGGCTYVPGLTSPGSRSRSTRSCAAG